MNKKYTLLASSPSTEGILEMIIKYFHADGASIKQPEAPEKLPNKKTPLIFDVHTSKNKKEGYRVILKKDRYRFEVEND